MYRTQADSDVVQRLVPGDGLETVGTATQWGGYAIRVVDDLGERDALLAGEARRQRMVFVRPKRDQTAVVDGSDHAAERLADPAERRLVRDHGYDAFFGAGGE